MSAASVLSNLVPLPTQSAAEENLENKLETLETDSSSSSGFALNNSEVGFQFNALPSELKNMVWNEISFVEGDSGNPRSEQEYRIRYSKVNLEWHEIKGKATKYDVGPRMDVIALSEILKENSKGSTAREFYIGHDVVTDEEAQAFASIFRSCNKLNILSIYAARQDDSYVTVNRIYELELSFALARLGDLRQLSIRGHYWD